MTILDDADEDASKGQSAPKASAGTSVLEKTESPSTVLPAEVAPEGFDEVAYLTAFPDIARSIKTGQFRSALHHYRVHGQRENRLADTRYQKALTRKDTTGFPAANVDGIYGCKAGQCMVYGWFKDDELAPVIQITLRNDLGLWGTTETVYRYRRKDVAASLGLPEDKNLGFWAILPIEQPEAMHAPAELILSVGSERKTFKCQIRVVQDEKFREITLESVAKALVNGEGRIETFLQLDKGLGRSLIAFNVDLSRRIALGAQTVQIGTAPTRAEGSIVVCLFGRADLLSIQSAFFSKCRGIDRYQLIFASNSPEIADRLIKDATIANRIYGIPIMLVLLPGNAGFGVANNVAVNAAHSDRILFVNPDIFPIDAEWPLQHSRMVKELPGEQVALFGVPLYYDDGSLMHGGMYFEVDMGFSFRDQKVTPCDMLRVEHYGKGAPPETEAFLASRPVPAVTGAFTSVNRDWFETLGGFSPEYVFGHYEDADLCLRSLTAGKTAWIHRLPFLHFEGKGSIPRPAQEGASFVNRWHFTRVWSEIVRNRICGPSPKTLTLRRQ